MPEAGISKKGYKNSAILKLDNREIPLMGSPQWQIKSGHTPNEFTFDVPRRIAMEFGKVIKPGRYSGAGYYYPPKIEKPFVTLEIANTTTPQTIRGLFWLHDAPGNNPEEMRVTIGDQRSYWNRKHVIKRMNMRRIVGYRRITTPAADELKDVTPDLWYWNFSLKDSVPGDFNSGRPWLKYDIAQYLADRSYDYMYLFWPDCPKPKVDKDGWDDVVIQNFELDDDLNTCWMRFMGIAPETKLYIDANGGLVVGPIRAKNDILTLREAGPEIWNSGFIQYEKRDTERPRYIDVLFTNEFEVRFDYEEPTDNTETAPANIAENRQLTNVLEVTDYTIGDYVQGDWISFSTALSLFNGDKPSGVNLSVDWPFLRAMMIPYMDMASPLRIVGGDIITYDWAARIDSIQKNFRKTFQIPREWLDSSIDIIDARVGIANPETGSLASPPVYSDWFRVYGRRNHLRQAIQGTSLDYGTNVFGYPSDGLISSNTVEAPAEVKIRNKDLGIIELKWKIDPYRLNEKVIPGTMLSQGVTGDLRQTDRPISFDSVVSDIRSFSSMPAMDSGYKMSLILTCIPAITELFRVRIYPYDVGYDAGDTSFQGPPQEIRIGRTVETAKYVWKDNEASIVAAQFGVGPPTFGVPSDPINYTGNVGGASLSEIARAAAKAVYWYYQEKRIGSASFDFNPKLTPQGFIDAITHTVSPSGTITSNISYPSEVPSLKIESLMSAETRAIIMRQPRRG